MESSRSTDVVAKCDKQLIHEVAVLSMRTLKLRASKSYLNVAEHCPQLLDYARAVKTEDNPVAGDFPKIITICTGCFGFLPISRADTERN